MTISFEERLRRQHRADKTGKFPCLKCRNPSRAFMRAEDLAQHMKAKHAPDDSESAADASIDYLIFGRGR